MRIAFVVHRYGRDVGGGSELHCRDFATRLAREHDVTVLTSCARDYVTWANSFPPGESEEDGVRIRRFPTSRQRDPRRFHDLSQEAFTGSAPAEVETAWFEENGPCMPDLLRYIEGHRDDYDRFFFFSYRYYQSFFGLPLVADKAILAPTAEEDPAINLRSLRRYFTLPRRICFNTHEERAMIAERCEGPLPPGEVVGSGLDRPAGSPSVDLLREHGIPQPFALYLGRVDPNKGCRQMLRYYKTYAGQTGEPLPLVLAGKAVMDLPRHDAILPLGYVSDALREALLAHCRLLVMPSPYESLCLVVLEAWNHGRPVLVNGNCRVLRGQVERANGGLYYRGYSEFQAALELLLEQGETADTLGRQGASYVEEHYRWPLVLEKLERLLK